ncbi:MAG: hypothetical protein GX287_08340 [Fusobacteria bacterium]|nr:hypothetical protein [Fusobacteriota bacterium]
MKYEELSKRQKEILEKSGWYEGRDIEIEEEVRLLEERGFEVSEKVKEYLREFNGIYMEVRRGIGGERIYIDKHYIDVEDAMGDAADRDMVTIYEEMVREKLVSVGGMDNDHLILMISETGKVYCSMGKLGNDIWEGIDVILHSRKRKIEDWDELYEKGEIEDPFND